MDKVWRLLTILGLVYFAVNLLFLLAEPLVWPDEVIMADFAQNLIRGNGLVSLLHGDLFQTNLGPFFYPPLVLYIYAGLFKLFGVAIEVQRVGAVVFGIGLLILLSTLSYKDSPKAPVFAMVVTSLLFISDFTLMRAARFGRPEVFVMVFSFASYTANLLLKGKWRLPLVAFFSALATLSHPLGLLSYAINGLTLTLENWKQLPKVIFFFSLSLVAVILIWLSSIDFNYLQLFAILKLQGLRRISEPGFFDYLQSQSSIFFGMVNYFYFLISVVLAVYWLTVSQKSPLIKLTLCGLILSWVIVFLGNESWYYVYPLPFVILLITPLIAKPVRAWGIVGYLIVALLLGTLYSNLQLAKLTYIATFNSYDLFAESIIQRIPANRTVLLTSIPDPYYRMINHPKNYRLLQFMPLPANKERLQTLLSTVDYVVYNDDYSFDKSRPIAKYLIKHRQKEWTVGEGSGYVAKVIKLKK